MPSEYVVPTSDAARYAKYVDIYLAADKGHAEVHGREPFQKKYRQGHAIGRVVAQARKDLLRELHEWAMDREALGYQQLPFGHLYEKIRKEAS